MTQVESRLEQLRAFTLDAFDRLEEVQELYRSMLDEVERIYHENEAAFQDLKCIRHKMMGARTLKELVEVMVEEIRYLDVDDVTISLVREVVESHTASGGVLPEESMDCLLLTGQADLAALFNSSETCLTYIGPRDHLADQQVFESDVLSCVLAPLVFRDQLIGSLNLGSHSLQRFTPDQSTDLIDDLAVTAALCIDSVFTHERNERLATTDPLTGCFNRRYFYQCAAKDLDLARRHGDNLSCIYMDLNDFKPINDRFGHDVGDMVLKKLVQHLKDRLRKTDILARVGGDEFVILLLREPVEAALHLVDTLKAGIESISFQEEGLADLHVSAAMGVAGLDQNDATLEDLVLRADQSMFRDKGDKKR